ncbi:unnamed protein product, partial [Prorocentrum cordatum]
DLATDRPSMAGHAKGARVRVESPSGGQRGQFLNDLLSVAASLDRRRGVAPAAWKLLAKAPLKRGLAKLLNGGDPADVAGKKRALRIEAKLAGDMQARAAMTVHAKKYRGRKHVESSQAIKQAVK